MRAVPTWLGPAHDLAETTASKFFEIYFEKFVFSQRPSLAAEFAEFAEVVLSVLLLRIAVTLLAETSASKFFEIYFENLVFSQRPSLARFRKFEIRRFRISFRKSMRHHPLFSFFH